MSTEQPQLEPSQPALGSSCDGHYDSTTRFIGGIGFIGFIGFGGYRCYRDTMTP